MLIPVSQPNVRAAMIPPLQALLFQVDGRVLYDSLHDKMHPAGITYAHLYGILIALYETSLV